MLARTRHAVAPQPVATQFVADASKLQVPQRWSPPSTPSLIPLVRTPAQLEAVIAAKLPEVELDWMELVGLEKAVTRARAGRLVVTIATTRVQKPEKRASTRG